MTDMQEKVGLKPCPFCGGDPAVSEFVINDDMETAWAVACNCAEDEELRPFGERYANTIGDNRERAIEQWNTRAPPTDAELLERAYHNGTEHLYDPPTIPDERVAEVWTNPAEVAAGIARIVAAGEIEAAITRLEAVIANPDITACASDADLRTILTALSVSQGEVERLEGITEACDINEAEQRRRAEAAEARNTALEAKVEEMRAALVDWRARFERRSELAEHAIRKGRAPVRNGAQMRHADEVYVMLESLIEIASSKESE